MPRPNTPALLLMLSGLAVTAIADAYQPAPPPDGSTQTPADTAAADDAIILDAMAGLWRGTLEYSNYGTNERVTLPILIEADRSTAFPGLTRRIEFTDPGVVIESHGTVETDTKNNRHIWTDLDPDGATTTAYEVTERTVRDFNDWRLVLSTRGEDDNRPADIRLTISLKGNTLESLKEVRYDEDDTWTFRNVITVARAQPDARNLLGTWNIDLRPTPVAPRSGTQMVIERIENGEAFGTFYGAPFSFGRVSTEWGYAQIAFVTNDGSGPYATTARLIPGREGHPDRLEGSTHSTGRGFITAWRSVRINDDE